MNKTRLEAFSDGVFAIIITIMVLEIKVPHGTEWSELKPLLPVFLSYVLSFIYVGIYWGNHHHLVHTAKNVSSGIIWANMHLLFWLSLIPFSTGWMGENHESPNTIIVYTINLVGCGVAFTVLIRTIRACTTFTPEMTAAFKSVNRKSSLSSVGYLVGIPLAYVNPIISQIIFASIAVVWLIPDKHIERAIEEHKDVR